MESSFRLGRIAGIEIGLHDTWLFAFGLVAWSLAGGFFPANYPGWDASTYWLLGVVCALALFASVLAHELSHSLVALSRGQQVRSITLFVFGGVSNLAAEAEAPAEELFVWYAPCYPQRARRSSTALPQRRQGAQQSRSRRALA
jgi:Zn-dependent protease